MSLSIFCFRDLTKLLGEPGHNSLNFGKALVAGWGRTYNDTADDSINIVSTPKLQKLEVPVLSLQRCLQKYKDITLNLSEDLRYAYIVSSLGQTMSRSLKHYVYLRYRRSGLFNCN